MKLESHGRSFFLPALLTFVMGNLASAAIHFAIVTGVDADKRTIAYSDTIGKNRDTEVKAPVAKNCVIKEGHYRTGKPARTVEGDDIGDGLKNPVFQKASDKNPLHVSLYTADEDDADKGIRKGDVIKILVNPPAKKKD